MSINKTALIKTISAYSLPLLIFVALFEISVGFLLNHAELLRFKRDNLLTQYYMGHDRSIIQYREDCARYDKDLSYTLKPGACRFANREFDTAYRINSLGMRDDEDSLTAPEVIVAGDSYAMGWGVEQDETFAQIIEHKTGLKVLNTAVSSYGTARELKALSRVSLDKAKFLIIQYCGNDYPENLSFLHNGNALPIMSEAEYKKTAAKYTRKTKYVFSKHTAHLLKSLTGRIKALIKPPRQKQAATSQQDAANAFIDTLLHAPINLDGLTVIVLELNELGRNDGQFIRDLNQRIGGKDRPLFNRLVTLDIAPKLSNDDFFVLDDHLKPHGHQVVADELIGLMRVWR